MMRKRCHLKLGFSARRRRAVTLVELVIAMAISTLLMVSVASVQFVSGRAIKELYGQTRTRSARMMALDQIRYRLYNAKIGSCAYSNGDDTNGYIQIDYINPNISATEKCRLFFTPSTKTLFYMASPNAEAEAVAWGPIDVRFLEQNSGATILVKVKSASVNTYGNDVDSEDGIVSVFLRNI